MTVPCGAVRRRSEVCLPSLPIGVCLHAIGYDAVACFWGFAVACGSVAQAVRMLPQHESCDTRVMP